MIFMVCQLSTLEGVLSTATHFLLRSYKEAGILMEGEVVETDRLNVAP